MSNARCHHGNTSPRYPNGRCKLCKREADAARYQERLTYQEEQLEKAANAKASWWQSLPIREQRKLLRQLKRRAKKG